MEAAEKVGIDRLLEPEDLLSARPNKLAVIAYLSLFREAEEVGVV